MNQEEISPEQQIRNGVARLNEAAGMLSAIGNNIAVLRNEIKQAQQEVYDGMNRARVPPPDKEETPDKPTTKKK